MTRPTLTQATGPAHTRILGIGGVRGERVVPNDELVGAIDSSDEWIRQRTGIVTRRRAEAGTDVLDLAEGAALAALANAGLTGADIDAVILSTVTYFHQTPAGCRDHRGPDRRDTGGCVRHLGRVRRVLLRHRPGRRARPCRHRAQRARHRRREDERASSTRPTAPSRSCWATALARSSSAPPTRPASARPSGAPTAARRRRSARRTRGSPRATRALGWPTLRQEGQSVYKWAVWQMAPVAQKAMDAAGVTADEIEAFIPHQANMRIIDQMIKTLKLPDTVVVGRDIADTGNTSAASIPLATERLLREGQVGSGALALQIGFGAGLVYAAQVVVLP